jgi:hypothetical protein
VLAGSAFKHAETVAKVKKNFTPILLDGDDPANADLGRKFGLHYFPSVIFTDMAGNPVETLDGADEDEFKAAVAKLAK